MAGPRPRRTVRGRGRRGSRWLAWAGILAGLLLVVAAAATPGAVGRRGAGGSVYVTGFDGNLSVLAAGGCGKPICQPRAFVQQSPSQSHQGASIAVSGGKVLLNSTDNTPTPDAPAQTNLYVLALR